MPRDWKCGYQRRLQRRASERGRRMAKARWQKDHERRELLAATDPILVGGRIVERVVRIIGESNVIDALFTSMIARAIGGENAVNFLQNSKRQ